MSFYVHFSKLYVNAIAYTETKNTYKGLIFLFVDI